SPGCSGEARDLAGAHGADLAETDFRDHSLEPGALDAACGRTAEIVVDHLDLGPAECPQAIPHGIWQRAAFTVVQNLMGRRLPDVKQRFAFQMMGTNLVRDHDRPPAAIRTVSRRHAPRLAASSDRSALPVSPPAIPATLACPLGRWGDRRRTGRAAARG